MAASSDPTVPTSSPVQFTLRSLLLFSTAAAVLFALIIGCGRALGIPAAEASLIFFGMQVNNAPTWIVWFVGGALVAARWRRHPRVSGYTLVALGGFAGVSIMYGLLHLWLTSATFRGGPTANYVMIYQIVSFALSLVHSACWILVFFAILASRTPPVVTRQTELP